MTYAAQGLTLRRLQPCEWPLMKATRLEALQKEPDVFDAFYAEEAALPDQKWQDRLSSDKRSYFGLFTRDEACVGFTGAAEHKDHPDAVILFNSYIAAPYRGKGLSGLFFAARLDWARKQAYQKAIVSCRETNLASKGAIHKAGFKQTHTARKQRSDGTVEASIFYELTL